MEKVILGRTGIEVTRLGFGALPIGPLQKNLSLEEGSDVIAYALDNGVNFIDTAQMYKTYPYIRKAIEKSKQKPVIATKSTAETYEDMEDAIKEAQEALGLHRIDIFHIHGARAKPNVFKLREGAFECLQDYKRKGIIKAIGISTHNVKTVAAAAKRKEVDIVFPLINRIGRGILEGNVKDMEDAIALCNHEGKGIYLMKVLGGGTLIDDFHKSVEYAMNLSPCYSQSIGMVSKEEVEYNIKYFRGERDLDGIINIRNKKEVKVLQGMCISCGSCIEVCHSEAIDFDDTEKAFIDESKCIQCGYCIASCPEFCIRIL